MSTLVASHVFRGIDLLLRLDFCKATDEVSIRRHHEKTTTAFDIIDALEVLRRYVHDSVNMIDLINKVSKPKYQGEAEFDFVYELKEDMGAYLLDGVTEKEGALKRRKNQTMAVTFLNPLIDQFQHSSHLDVIKLYDKAIDECIAYVYESDIESNEIDAMVVRKLIQKEIHRHNTVTRIIDGIMRIRRRKRKKKRTAE